MKIEFDKPYLLELYRDGKCSDKKHRFQPDIVRRYQKALTFMKNASSIEVLTRINSLNYEVLSGDKAGISSVRVNDKDRIEFTVDKNTEEPVLTVCNILELTNHYK